MKKGKLFRLAFSLMSAFALTSCAGEAIVGPQGPQGEQGEKGETGVSIVAIDLTSSDGLADVYTITYSDGSTSNFVVTNGKDGEQGIQGVPGEDGHTPTISISADGYWVVDGVKTDTKAQGEQGEPGKDGTSLLTGNGSPANETGKNGDSYIDLDTWDFYVKASGSWMHIGNIKGDQGITGNDGQDGEDGMDGQDGEDGIDGQDGTSVLTGQGEPSPDLGGNGDSYIDLSNWDYYVKEDVTWVLKGNIKGNDGLDGEDGLDGNGIVSIELTDSSGNVDTYTITYDNGDTTTFTVTNGVDGEQGIQGEPGKDGHTPIISIGENGNWHIDGEDTGVLAEGVQGPQGEPGQDGSDGEDGLSAYEIYIKYHPEYVGTEQEWLEDLVNGDLREEYKITFQTNGGSAIEPQYVKFGRLVTKPADDPTRTGYLFDGWYLNSEPFPFNSYQVYDDLTLQAHWKSMNVNLTFDANGGDVEYNTKVVTYGVDYVLPTPTRENYTFDGWYLDETQLCPISGVWTFSKVDITLKARWAGTQVDVSFASDENIEVEGGPITLVYGDDFTLPVPTILTGDKFIGWADSSGELVTDENGQSLKPSEFKTNTELHAVYYVPVTTPNQLLNLCTAEAGDERLSRTYILQNDLDFTGLANESIYNFTGIFDGNGYDIIGLEKPLFGSVGRSDVTCTDDIEVKNVNLVNFSGESFVNQVRGCSTLKIDSVTIESFVKDESNYCETYGIVKTIGYIKAPTNFYMNNCHIIDEFATIESGLVYELSGSENVNLLNCSVKSDTKQSAFISQDLFSSSNYLDSSNPSPIQVNISYCSNYGNTQNLMKAAAIEYYYSESFGYQYYRYQEININNVSNYGDVEDALFVNCKNNIIGEIRDGTQKSFSIEKVLNFGSCVSFVDIETNSSDSDDQSNLKEAFCLNSCFNAGSTSSASFNITSSATNNYQFVPLAGIEDFGAFSVTNYSQINSDFFINTIGLDSEKWNLSYINIQDEYGLPTIIY